MLNDQKVLRRLNKQRSSPLLTYNLASSFYRTAIRRVMRLGNS